MKRVALIAASLLVALLPGSAQASVTQYSSGSCTFHWHAHGDTVPFLCLTESSSYGGDKLVLTGSSDIPDLRFIQHTPGGLCSPKVAELDDNWGDCITAVWAKLGTNDSVCLFDDNQYNELIYSAAAPSSPAGMTWTYADPLLAYNDRASSAMLQQSGTPCSSL